MKAYPSLLAAALLLGACSEPVELEWRHEIGGASYSTPLVTEGFIALGSELGLTILEPDGKPRCTFGTAGEVVAAPRSDGKLIFFGATNYVFYAVDLGCKEVWKVPTGDRIKSDALVVGERVFATSYDGHVYAFEAATGKTLWTFPALQPARLELPPEPAPPPAAETKPRALADKRSKGKRRAEPPPPPAAAPAAPPAPPAAPRVVPGDFSYSSPAHADGVLYVGNLDHHLYAIDAADGSLRWRYRTAGPVTSSPLVIDGVVYFGSNDGNLYAIDVDKREPLWKLPTKDWMNSSPRHADGVLYVGSNDRHIYAIELKSGRTQWRAETAGPAIAIPAVYQNLVIGAGASGDGAVYALQRDDGSAFWRFETGGSIESDPVVVGDRVYVTSGDGYLYAFRFKRTTSETKS